MREFITLDVAKKLFLEAADFSSGRKMYLQGDSEIRKIALKVFHKDHASYLIQICNDIFYVLACEYMNVVV